MCLVSLKNSPCYLAYLLFPNDDGLLLTQTSENPQVGEYVEEITAECLSTTSLSVTPYIHVVYTITPTSF